MHEATAISTLSSLEKFLEVDSSHHFKELTLFQQVVGALQYLALTHPNNTMVVNKADQFMHTPSVNHWQAVKRILRYLKGTADHGMVLHSSHSNNLIAFSYANWGGDKADHKSTLAYAVFHGSNLISWCSKKQKTVARSNTDSEYRAFALATSEVRQKHLLVSYIPTADQLADVLTKPLSKQRFLHLKDKLLVVPPIHLWGNIKER
ncbi:hypothetical protein GH714_035829 [Hevea brasiliensis]|uniref:Reverse transcriptase Ty1/copia-type domain-containing protein n=1 Tax=Hevea brasiliensis TaxID=3981 RepID=A0A6A6NDA9_HEVBR|nr:hypothetical protein GH714_035829 [Hevea brasiliensis]